MIKIPVIPTDETMRKYYNSKMDEMAKEGTLIPFLFSEELAARTNNVLNRDFNKDCGEMFLEVKIPHDRETTVTIAEKMSYEGFYEKIKLK